MRHSALELLSREGLFPVIEGYQVSATKSERGFVLQADAIGRSLQRYVIEFAQGGRFLAARLDTMRRSDSRIDSEEVPGGDRFANLLLSEVTPERAGSYPRTARYAFCNADASWIDMNHPRVALQSNRTIPKGSLCYPIMTHHDEYVGTRDANSGRISIPEVQRLLSLPSPGMVTTDQYPHSVATSISLRTLQELAQADGIELRIENDSIKARDAHGTDLSTSVTVKKLISNYWAVRLPKAILEKPCGHSLGQMNTVERPIGVPVSTLQDVIRALSVVHVGGGKPPLTKKQIHDVALATVHAAASTRDQYEATGQLNRKLSKLSISSIDGWDARFLCEYMCELRRYGSAKPTKSIPTLTCGIDRDLDPSPFRCGDHYRHVTIQPIGGWPRFGTVVPTGEYILQVSYTTDKSDSSRRTTSIAEALEREPARKGVICSFHIQATRSRTKGDIFAVNLGKIAKELNVADPQVFMAAAMPHHDLSSDQIEPGCRVVVDSHEFVVRPALDNVFSYLGAHEVRPGYIGHLESEIFRSEEGGDALPTLQFTISRQNEGWFTTSSETNALDTLVAKLRLLGTTLDKGE